MAEQKVKKDKEKKEKKEKKIIIKTIIICVIIAIGIAIGVGVAMFLNKKADTQNTQDIRKDAVTILQKNISGQYSDVKVTDFETAKESIEGIKEKLNIDSVSTELQEQQSNTNDMFNTYSFKQLYNGIEVIDGGLMVYADTEGNTKGIVNKYERIKDLDVNAKNTAESLKGIVEQELKKENEDIEITDGQLVIYPYNDKYILAYKYELSIGLDNANAVVYVSDETKEILSVTNPVYTLEDYSEFLKNGKYLIDDRTRNISIEKTPNSIVNKKTKFQEYTWDNAIEGENEENQLAIKAMKTIQKIYDYYKEKHNWISVDGKGRNEIEIITGASKVYDANNKATDNFETNAAYVHPKYIILGSDNLYNDNIEVLGHEYTHGVFYHTVGKCEKSTLETRALSEAYADIMGMCIDAKYKNENELDWYINSSKGRNIKDSKVKYSDLPIYSGKVAEWIYAQFDKEEHYYSTIISRAAYLMKDVMTLEELENLWYKSMALLPDNPNFYDCVYAVLISAKANGFSDTQIQKIVEAFSQVGLNATNDLNNYFGKIEGWAEKGFENKDSKENNNVIGEWEATKTSNAKYALDWIYGTSIRMCNSLKLNADGTYELYLGFAFSQQGTYEIDGTTIKLTNNGYTGDSPEHEYKIAQQLKINGEQILLEEKSDNTPVNIIFEKKKDILNDTSVTQENNNTQSANSKNGSSQNNNRTEKKSETENNGSKSLTKEDALKIIEREYGSWKGLKLSYQYYCTIKDKEGNEYYAINTFSPENFDKYGGEWLEEVEKGKFYAGTYYVSCKYENNSVRVGKNERDWEKYKNGDTINYFLQTFNVNV